MKVSLIVAASQNNVIGKDGKIPWFVRGEQKRFKELTMGHPIIMGRKTHESTGRTLPGRLNVVISSNPNFKPFEGSVLVSSLQAALDLSEVKSAEEVFIIGGQQVFTEAMPLADRLYLTKIHTTVDGDKFFEYDPNDWRLVSSEFHKRDEVPDRPFDFEICLYERRR
nr:Dihydrofolate reductase [uncultured bacterium]AIA19306.1 Dihydrofolate reductase [uncultured bacterium]